MPFISKCSFMALHFLTKPNPDLQKLVKRGMLYIRILGIWYPLLSKKLY